MHRIFALFCCSFVVLLSLVGAGCGPGEGPTGGPGGPKVGTVVVGVTSDLRVGVDIVSVHVVMRAGGEVLRDDLLTATSESAKLKLPAEFAFPDRDAGEAIDITLEAFRPGDSVTPLVTRRAATEIVAGKTLLFRVALDSRCVAAPGSDAPICGGDETCLAGFCVDAHVDAQKLEDYAPAWATTTTDICKPAGAGAPTVVVGEGQSDYLPMGDGEVAQLEAGPQGGHHIWVAIRMKNLTQSGSITSVTGYLPALDADVGPFNVIFTFDQDEGGYCKLYGLRFQLDQNLAIEELLGKVLDVRVTVTDKDGGIGIGERTVKLSNDFL